MSSIGGTGGDAPAVIRLRIDAEAAKGDLKKLRETAEKEAQKVVADSRRGLVSAVGAGVAGAAAGAAAAFSRPGTGGYGVALGATQGAAAALPGIGGAVGAVAGAAIGSVVPGAGTAIGAAVGSAVGTAAGQFGQAAVERRTRNAEQLNDMIEADLVGQLGGAAAAGAPIPPTTLSLLFERSRDRSEKFLAFQTQVRAMVTSNYNALGASWKLAR